MTFPPVKLFKKWLPIFGMLMLYSWMGLLVFLNLIDAYDREHAEPPIDTIKIPMPEGNGKPGCTTMPDGSSVCEKPITPLNGTTNLNFNANMQPICALGKFPDFYGTIQTWDAHPTAIKSVHWITEITGILPNFEILEAKFRGGGTALAIMRGRKRYIVYDTKKFQWKNNEARWSDVAIVAHEVGHHLGGHLIARHDDDHKQELEADRYSGFAMAMLGATRKEALSWTSILSKGGSKSHPGKSKRVNAVIEGWKLGKKTKFSAGLVCKPSWIEEPLKIGAQQCRLARKCEDNKSSIGIACQTDQGSWVWQS